MATRERKCREMSTRARNWKLKKVENTYTIKTSCELESKVTNVRAVYEDIVEKIMKRRIL
jgi:hypothetical protein